jgi:hypothetical protein
MHSTGGHAGRPFRWLCAATVVFWAADGFSAPTICEATRSSDSKRLVRISDTIEMTRVAGDSYYYDGRPANLPLAYFSPRGDRFVVVLRKGNMETNANDYSMLLFQAAQAFDSPRPDVVVQMSSTSNGDAIREVKWVDDDTIAFLGENSPEAAQVYTLDLKTRKLERRTRHITDVLEYRIAPNASEVLFLAERDTQSHGSQEAVEAIPITTQTLPGILSRQAGHTERQKAVFTQAPDKPEWEVPMMELPAEEKQKTNPAIEVSREEGMNLPQKLFVVDKGTHKKALLLDLNPQFDQLDFARVEAIDWKGTDGRETTNGGGLYLPAHYQPGKRYPLVIQTHFFKKDLFLINGPWSSGYSAQALAAKGFMVLQVDHAKGYREREDSPAEAPAEMAMYEGAIDFLDRTGRIDRNRVGIFGFSRTVYHVAYTLTHSRYPFAAAVLEDGIDGGYLQYLDFPWIAKYFELLHGGTPFGSTLASWAKDAPGFNLDRVSTPVQIVAHGYAGALQQWEWYSGLKLIRKPVAMIVLPAPGMGEHLLKKPREQLASEESLVDWFCYWLQDEQDPSPAKRAQYELWGKLKELPR